jgi:hypothetical protein
MSALYLYTAKPAKRRVDWIKLTAVIGSLTFCVLVWRLVYLYIVLPIQDVMPALAEIIGKLGKLLR